MAENKRINERTTSFNRLKGFTPFLYTHNLEYRWISQSVKEKEKES